MAQIIVYLICAGFGVLMLVVGVTRWRDQRSNLKHAQPVTATIEHGQVFTSISADTNADLLRSTSTTTHRPDLRFRYLVAGRPYVSDWLNPSGIAITFASKEEAARVLAPYPLGAQVQACVDPSRPDKAFLEREASSGPVVFIVIGLLMPAVAWLVGMVV